MASLVDEAVDVSVPTHILSTIALHVFLPLKLPQEAEESGLETTVHLWLCQLVAFYAHEYRQQLPTNEQSLWDSLSRMLEHLARTVDMPLHKEQLGADLNDLTNGGTDTCKHHQEKGYN
jgi:hypothetical protein